LGLIAEPLGPLYKAEDRYFGNAAKHLSALRDSAVMIETLDALAAKHNDVDAGALAAIRRNLERHRRETPPDEHVSAEVIRALNEARPKAASWPLEGLQYADLLPDMTAAYRGGRKALKHAQESQTVAALHDFRKNVKRHWYHLRLFESALTGEMKKRVTDLRDLETWLGDEHNINVLCWRISADVETSRDRQQTRQVSALLAEEAKSLRQRALESGERLYASKPREFSDAMAALWPTIPRRPAAAVPFRKTAVA
jgi:CHAD domain-containing protein